MILVIASCVLSNGPLVHFSASRSDGITSYGVAVRFDGARTRKVVPAGVLEFPELQEELQDVPLVAPGMLGPACQVPREGRLVVLPEVLGIPERQRVPLFGSVHRQISPRRHTK